MKFSYYHLNDALLIFIHIVYSEKKKILLKHIFKHIHLTGIFNITVILMI